ncbi:uncharacterized protein BCR38DRAFT_470102 [Pseudomassariella vexata]|uniref:Zn(2)-C6 fungal-type domain-containing protein n=1 Tax=Pseudomassariella vexata TaxID=1141098 RepID=A0A1Y2EHL3_9PEZI|nr:uncharacterized protein BCR38DRAFT_470102 [Pseudomassariella vexata]ORY71060.1 hypothetical protein BCR38DRAFT_470102 [Pseudomassariella vexata]
MAPRPKPNRHISLPSLDVPRSRSVSDRSDRSDGTSSQQSGEPSTQPAWKRASKPKVRTGCISCKKRHVKCDERKPHCLKCDNMNIDCEGYVQPKPSKAVSRAERLLLPKAGPAPLLAKSTVNSEFQPAGVQPPLLLSPGLGFEIGDDDGCIGAYARALIDLTNDYPWITSADRPWWPASVVNRHHQAALSHHSKALSYLRQDIEVNGVDSRTTMAVTLLFIVFENTQGTTMQLAVSYARGSSSANIPFPHCKSAYHLLLDEDDLPTDEENVPNEYTIQATTPHSFQHAHAILETILPSLGKFYAKAVWHNLHSSYEFDEDDMTREQALHLAKVRGFGNLVIALKAAETDGAQLQGLSFMTMHHQVATIFLSSCLDRTETTYDHFTSQFEEIVSEARQYFRLPAMGNKSGFTNENGLLPLLSFVVAKCRVRRTRLAALDMIRRSTWREGPWDGTSLSNAMDGLMKLEGQMPFEDQSGYVDDFFDCVPPPESRYTWTNIFWDFERRQMTMEYTKILPNDQGEFEKVKCVMSR